MTFRWPFRRRARVEVRVLNSFEITLRDWQRAPDLVQQAKRIFATPEFRAMLDCLRTESPANYSLPLTGVSMDDRAVHALHIEGYNLALNNLAAMTRFNAAVETLDATFAPEPIPASVPEFVAPPPDYPEPAATEP